MTHVVLSLGSNIEREKNTRYAIREIADRYGDLDLSPVYETSSVGFDGPAFFNLIAGFRSDQPVQDIVVALKQIELDAGRIQGPKTFASRVLDIDIVLYGDKNLRPRGMNIPRDEIEKYAYVLKPLADIYPDLVHPVTHRTIAEMWADFEIKDQTLFITEFAVGRSSGQREFSNR